MPAAARSANCWKSQPERFESLLADGSGFSPLRRNAATPGAKVRRRMLTWSGGPPGDEQWRPARGTRIDFRLPPEPASTRWNGAGRGILRTLLDKRSSR